MTFTVRLPGTILEIETVLRGKFNVSNILAAIGVFVSLGIDSKKIPELISHIETVPGRMDEVKADDGFSVFIDYAHTADALENVLTTLQEFKSKGRIITVF